VLCSLLKKFFYYLILYIFTNKMIIIKYKCLKWIRRIGSSPNSSLFNSSNSTPTQRDNGMSFIEVKKKAVKGFPILEYWKSKKHYC